MQNFPISPVNGLSNSTEQPIYPKKGGKITLDQQTPEIFFQLVCGTGGAIVILGLDGNPYYNPSVATGQILVGLGKGVLTSATIDGEFVTTTATNIWWFGGV